MDNKGFKESLRVLRMTKKEFADEIKTSINTVNGWTQKGFPDWVEVMTDTMLKLHECKQQILGDIYNEQKKQTSGFIDEEEDNKRSDDIAEMFKRLEALEKNQSK